MAFAPPRQLKTDQSGTKTRRPQTTRLPVASPSKKTDESVPAVGTQSAVKHESRVIPSRYAQSAVVKSRSLKDSSIIPGKATSTPYPQLRSQNTALRASVQEKGIVPASPTKSSQVRKLNHVKHEQAKDEHLSLRLLQIIQTCQEGEKALAEYKLSAQTQLTAKWEALSERQKTQDLRTTAKRTQDTLSELKALTESDVLVLENFVSRLEQLEDFSLSCSREFDEWSQNVRGPISSAWTSTLEAQLSIILAMKQSTTRLVDRFLQMPTRGNVYRAIEALTTYLTNIELELKDMSDLSKQLWLKRIKIIGEEFDALHIVPEEKREPYVWDIR